MIWPNKEWISANAEGDMDKVSLSKDTIFDILSNPRRRYLLYYLSQKSDPVNIQELTEQIAQWEATERDDDFTEQYHKRVYISIYQNHIPKLIEAGIVSFDRNSGLVSLEEEIPQIRNYFMRTDPIIWPLHYLLLSILGICGYILVLSDIYLLQFVPDIAAYIVIIFSFFVLSIIHYLYDRPNRISTISELFSDETTND